MEERHENEQYFFDEPTVSHLADVIEPYPLPCCLCAPTVGRELESRGVDVRILDLDERFNGLKGFLHFDLRHPAWTGESYGIIVFDPPFFNAVPVSRMFDAIRMLSRFQTDQRLLISWPKRRADVLLRAFSRFRLEPTGYIPGYKTVSKTEKNEIEFHGNLDEEMCRKLLDIR